MQCISALFVGGWGAWFVWLLVQQILYLPPEMTVADALLNKPPSLTSFLIGPGLILGALRMIRGAVVRRWFDWIFMLLLILLGLQQYGLLLVVVQTFREASGLGYSMGDGATMFMAAGALSVLTALAAVHLVWTLLYLPRRRQAIRRSDVSPQSATGSAED